MSSIQLKSATKLARRAGIHVPGGVNGGGWVRLSIRLGADPGVTKNGAKLFIMDWLEKQRLAADDKHAAAGCKTYRPAKTVATIRPPKPKRVAGASSIEGVDVASDAFLSTYAWRRKRMEVLRHYGSRCMCCGATPATGAVMNVDHIKPRKLFPHLALEFDNLQILCHECNHGKGNWCDDDWREPPIDPEQAAHLRSILRGG